MNDQLSVLAKIICQTIAPDYSKLIAEIRKHNKLDKFLLTNRVAGKTTYRRLGYKVLFVTSDTCVVQECAKNWQNSRCRTVGIPLAEWGVYFRGWIDVNHVRWGQCFEAWHCGLASEFGLVDD